MVIDLGVDVEDVSTTSTGPPMLGVVQLVLARTSAEMVASDPVREHRADEAFRCSFVKSLAPGVVPRAELDTSYFPCRETLRAGSASPVRVAQTLVRGSTWRRN